MSASPIYVQVQDNIPLHVHVKKPKRTDNSKQESRRISGRTCSRVKSKIATELWIPAPGKTSTRDRFDKNYKWDSEKAQLEINQPKSDFHLHTIDQGPLKISDLSTEEDNHLPNNINNYERKIETLMAEVGTLKNELELKQVEKELEDKKEQLEISKAVLEDKQRELRYIAKEFEDTENVRLRKSMEKYQEDLATSIEKLETAVTDDDTMHRQLVALEVCGAEAGKQAAALRDIVQRLKYEKRLSHTDINALNNQRELFLQKLEEFETSNRTVRRLLQTEHKTLSDVKRLESQRDILMKKLADSDSDIFRVRSELIQKSADLEQLLVQVNEEKNHARTLNELNKSVEATRAHLQRELRSKEMENNRLQVQLKNMERDTSAIREEAERLSATAKSERETLAKEKEGLKRAARSLRNKAEKAEASLKELEYRLADKERKIEEVRSQADGWRERYQRASDDKARLEDHVQSLSDKVAENETASRANDILLRNKEDEMKKHLDRLTSENVRYRTDIDRCKSDISLAEDRCLQAQQEAVALRNDLRQQESIEEDLRKQLRKVKSEAEEALLAVEKVERSSRRMRDEGCCEIERVREQMLERMKDLQPLPELLKETEMKLQDAQDKLHVYEQRSAEQTRIIAELTNKDGAYNDEVSVLKQRLSALTDENRALEARLQILHVKLDDRDLRVKETVLDTVNKDEKLQQLQLKLEEISHERDGLKRQLDSAISDSRKAVESEIDKAVARDHANQSRIVDLETNITRLKADITALKRAREDSERRNQSKLQDARDRLEQAESTNRSMRNYVNFLKKSYTNVFGTDSSLTSTPIRSYPGDVPNSSFL